ncbi:MAG: DUF917 domain-containing protein [Candidatus Eremiobacteraeota bacterium]|nr:DUF917 domain-containing protein [Candidatus Eremiobacteraeota bacterium]
MICLDNKDLDNILRGAQILGCGGGGEIEWGKGLIECAIKKGKSFKLLSINDKNEDREDPLICIIGAVGGGVSDEIKRKTAPILRNMSAEDRMEKPILRAVEELAAYKGQDPGGFIPTEIGAGNMAVTMFAAAMQDKFVLDGDCCGRAKPMISISTTGIAGIPQTPLACINALGDVMILKDARNDIHAEDICRSFAVVSGGTCYCARCMQKLSRYVNAMIPGSFTRCLKLGNAMSKARESADNPASALLEVEKDAKILFRGEIISHEKKYAGGFITGMLKLKGNREYKGHNYDVWFKNEFLAGFLDARMNYKCPDLICVINEDEYRGVSNWDDFDEETGAPVTVAGIPSHPIWKTEKGLEIFSYERLRR